MTNFKVVSWNINSINVRIGHLLEFIAEYSPDIICLQELKCETEKFPYDAFSTLPYNLYIHGQKSYNGVAILSKLPADEIRTNFIDNPLPEQSRFIETTMNTPIGYLRVISLYVPNGGEVGSEKFVQKLEFYDAFTAYLKSIRSIDEKLVIASDFNVAPFDNDVYSPKALEDSTCFTLEEKRKLRTILNNGMVDSYRVIHPDKKEFSWWDYRAGAFEQNNGMRIDTILSSANLTKNIVAVHIDYKTRSKPKPSDHAPVIVEYIISCEK